MAIKKPLIKNRVQEREEEEASKKSLLKKKAPPVVEEEEEEVVEEEEEEPEPPKKGLKKKAPPAEEEEEEEAPPRKGSLKKKGSKDKKSLADVFDSTKPGRGLFPVGEFQAYINGFEFDGEIAEEGEEQGMLKVKVTYEGHEDEEEVAGKIISQWYQIATEDGAAGPGIPFLKGDLDVLGYEDVILADLQEIFDDVESTRPLVVIKVKQNGQYTNAFLQGLAEGE